MTTAPVEPAAEPVPSAAPRASVAVPIASHAGIDFVSFVTISLLPLLAVRLGMTDGDKSVLIAVAAVASGGSQPVVAYFCDRHDARWLATAGVVLAGLCIGAIGFAANFPMLIALQALGAIGVGAFHPPAAAAVGQIAGPRRRGPMLSAFFLAGMLGGMTGNVLAPRLVAWVGPALASMSGAETDPTTLGLWALALVAPACMVMAVVLGKSIHDAPHRPDGAHDDHAGLSASERRRRWAAFGLLYFGNIVRFSVNQALVYLFIVWVERLARARAGADALDEALGLQASTWNGPLQAGMQLGMGGGGMLLGFIVARGREKLVFMVLPAVGAVGATLMPHTDGLGSLTLPAAGVCAVTAGAGFGALIPVTMTVGQRLLPHRTGLVSGMLLGGAWCFAFVAPLATRLFHKTGLLASSPDSRIEPAFAIVGGVMLLTVVLGALLPARLLRETAEAERH